MLKRGMVLALALLFAVGAQLRPVCDVELEGEALAIGCSPGALRRAERTARLTAEEILYDDVLLRIMTYTGISAPKFLKVVMENTEVDAAISVKFNISAVSTLWGEQKGRWSAEAGIVLENVPTEMVPDCFQPKSYMKSDLWLFRMVFTERETA